jgi:hypothetical protein
VSDSEEEKKRKKGGVSEGPYIWGGGQGTISPVLKVPRQCPFLFLVEVRHTIGIVYVALEGLHYNEILMLPLGGLHAKQAM